MSVSFNLEHIKKMFECGAFGVSEAVFFRKECGLAIICGDGKVQNVIEERKFDSDK